MDSKQMKTLLKQAKEAIKNKEITSALSFCKDVLKEDRNNYLALVLLGAAFQESDQREQAPNAYRKAIEVSPDQILAWQGLSAFYEKDDCEKHAEQLVPVYQRMLELESESAKWCGIIFKIQNLILKLKHSDDVIAKILSEYKSTENEEKFVALYECMVYYLSRSDNIPMQHIKLFEEVLNRSRNKLEDKNNFQIYFKLLYKQNKRLEILEFGEELYDKVSEGDGISEWMCKVWSEEFVEARSSVVEWCDRLQKHCTCLLEADKDNVLALMAKGAYQICQKAYLEARESLQACIALNRGLFHAICLLAEANLHLLCPELAEQHAQVAMNLRPDSVFPKAVLVKALALTDDPNNWKKAVGLATEVLGTELAVEGLCEAHLRLHQWKDLLSAVSSLTHAPALAAFYQREGAAEGREPDLLVSLAANPPDCPEAFYRLGLLYLADQQDNLACTAFLKCAKLAPYWHTAYRQLGHLYSRAPVTLDKARRCYQRALVLKPTDISTQIALSDTYWALGDAESNLTLLEGVSQRPEGKWAWPRLGLLYSHLGESTTAINCLRSALKTDPSNSHLWEALADAYLSRGANGSALKSYQKVLELKPGTFYPALQIATIKQITDLPEESLLEFRELVKQQPNSILALKGLCDTCICLAKNFLTQRLLGLSRDRLQEGLVAIASALQVRPEMACLWKLAGDCLTMAGSLPRSWHFLEVPEVLCSSTTEDRTLNGLQLLELGARCLCRCLKLMTGAGKGLVWHDLALNYRQQAKLSEGASRAGMCQRALAAAKESVTLSPLCWQHWNVLGVVGSMPEVKKYALAQHAFIKATTLDDTVAVPWFNLGCLYLSLHELKLANSVFKVAQSIDSEFCPSWVGQALIAEIIENDDTMDLFRHTTQLGYIKESCVGYAQWVCQTLLLYEAKKDSRYVYSIEKMHAVPVAIDALTWATDEEEDDACALNMLGCLLERAGLLRSSVTMLSRAVEHSPALHRNKALANFGRVLLKAGKVQDAIEVYGAITKPDIHSQCGLALSLYKGKLYQEACEAYEAARDWYAADDTVKGHLNVALALVTYKMAGPEQAKILLLQGNQMKSPSVHGLFATCSLGMLNSDLELSKLVLRDLLPYQNQAEFIPHIALFQAYVNFIQGDLQGSVWSMSRTVHRQPALAALWLHLALLILQKQSVSVDSGHKVVVAAQCALTAITLGRTSMDVSKVLAVVSLSLLMGGEVKRSLSASQHAVHLYPAVGESWAVLAASCYAANQPTPLRPLLSHARQHIDLERPLAKWMSNFERKIAMIASSS